MLGSAPGSSRARQALASLLIVVCDQIAKLLVDRNFDLHESRVLIEGLLSLTYVQNHGAAFGLLADAGLPYQPWVFTLVSLLALGAIGVYAARLPASHLLAQRALALVMGGALGNLLDRARLGYVIDFVDVYWGAHHWPAFNVADSAISVGVMLLVLDVLRTPERRDDAAEPLGAAPSTGSPE